MEPTVLPQNDAASTKDLDSAIRMWLLLLSKGSTNFTNGYPKVAVFIRPT